MEKGLRIAVVLMGVTMLLGAIGFMFSPRSNGSPVLCGCQSC